MDTLRAPLFALALGGAVIVTALVAGFRSGGGPRAAGPDGFLAAPAERPPVPSPASAARAAAERRLAPLRGPVRDAIDAAVARWLRAASEHSDGRAHAGNVTVAVHAVEAQSGAELCAREADRALRPASNMKLVTTAAALVLLGPDWHFETVLEAGGRVTGDTLRGDVVVRAGGDPLYRAEAGGRVEARLDEVARAIRERGIRRVEGGLVLDEGTFPPPGPGPEWPPADQSWTESCALAAGLTVHGGILHARVEPRGPGQPARVEVHPEPHGLRRRYGVETVTARVNDVRVGANAAGVTVTGRIGRKVGPVEAGFSHPDPVGLFGAVLRDRLERGGVRLRGETRRQRDAPGGAALATLRSPLTETLVPILRDSVNSVADQVFLACGRAVAGRADREAGAAATRRALARLGVPLEGLVQVDGSGLSRADRVSPRQLTALLRAALAQPGTGDLYRAALAVAGESGTLADRMRDSSAHGRVQAKTGWIRGTSALSGVALGLDGTEWIFSVLVDYPAELSGLNTHAFKPLQDEIAAVLVEAGA